MQKDYPAALHNPSHWSGARAGTYQHVGRWDLQRDRRDALAPGTIEPIVTTYAFLGDGTLFSKQSIGNGASLPRVSREVAVTGYSRMLRLVVDVEYVGAAKTLRSWLDPDDAREIARAMQRRGLSSRPGGFDDRCFAHFQEDASKMGRWAGRDVVYAVASASGKQVVGLATSDLHRPVTHSGSGRLTAHGLLLPLLEVGRVYTSHEQGVQKSLLLYEAALLALRQVGRGAVAS